MILLMDIGNTHAHIGLASRRRILRRIELPTPEIPSAGFRQSLNSWLGNASIEGACFCSVVPHMNIAARTLLPSNALHLTHRTVRGVGIDYPNPKSIGQDRLANAVAAQHRFGAPAVVVDFGTAVTFDVIDPKGNYVGGIIAPGLAVMTDYLHEKTALLPRIRIQEPRSAIGRSTRGAMLSGAVFGYAGLIRELIEQIRGELAIEKKSLPVIATGGYAKLMARQLPVITHVNPNLTLEGLRLVWQAHNPAPLSPRL
jgi:type III pantothenate kinase